MSQHVVRRLRPFLFHNFDRSCLRRSFSQDVVLRKERDAKEVTHDYEKRVAQLEALKPLAQCYPRLPQGLSDKRVAIKPYRLKHGGDLKADETLHEGEVDQAVTVAGRLQSVRTAGSKLVFADISDGSGNVQAVLQFGKLERSGVDLDRFKAFAKTARRGDWYAVTGWPHKTARGELSILASELPRLFTPSLHQIPEALDDPETRARQRHVDMLVNPSSIQPLLVRHHLEQQLNHFFDSRGFVRVRTPLLSAGAGGAVARPFETEATELEGQKLNLRIAPELWLKRLVVGGLNKVYEIGPAFRNEGVDATHNPEFTICEFYQAFATLEDLMTLTEAFFDALQTRFAEVRKDELKDLPNLDIDLRGPFKRLEFIPVLERGLNRPLPILTAPDAQHRLLDLFSPINLPTPTNPTLPRLLDTLATTYLEPLCHGPTFITNHPACLSPLSKHFLCPTTNQFVAARAELFIRGREYANMYEEENSPFEQRRKLVEQVEFRAVDKEGDGRAEVDESYLEALEWGLPPTGGWGIGVDRLVMLFSGRERMADVLAFGSLRNVVGLGRGRR